MHHRAILFAVLIASVPGCYATGHGYGYGYQASYTAPAVNAQVDVAPVQTNIQASVDVSGPELVSVAPDVQVIVDHEEPVFFSDGFYWRETNGAWFRSSVHTGDWSYHAAAPYAVRSLERRDSYRRYRPANYVSRRGYDRSHRQPVRGYDTRDNRRGYDSDYRDTNRVRDNRGSDYRGSDYRGSEYRGSDYRGSDRGRDYRGTDRVRDNRGSDYRGSDRGRDYRGSDRGSDRGRDHRGSDRGSDRGRDSRGSDRGRERRSDARRDSGRRGRR